MRRNLVHENAGNLVYEIREIVAVAREIEAMGQSLTWENIGDPVHKGEAPPDWIRGIVHELIDEPATWGYCDTAGVPATREFLAKEVNKRGGAKITANDIIFFNGLGDGVAKVYHLLRRDARVLGPTPAYSTHSSGELAHTGYKQATYQLDPANGWLPDVEDIRRKVKYNDTIAGIVLLSPDNPTGTVYPRYILDEIAAIARDYDLFIMTDEIYVHIIYSGEPRLYTSQWIGDVPAISLRGISKEYPWPGGRCGWIEAYNRDKDKNFSQYVDTILAAKRLEVSSTTLPQKSIPRVMGDPRYPGHLKAREAMYSARADEAVAAFKGCDHVFANKPGGAFYFTVMIKDGRLNDSQTLPIPNARVRAFIEEKVKGVKPDKRFVYYLMGATGIVVVPMSGFFSDRHGFRFTLLESDAGKREWIYRTLRESVEAYVES